MKSFILPAAALSLLIAAPALAQDNPGGAASKTPPPMTGEQVYQQVCQACHMADGKGATGAATIASLANNPKLKYPAYPITIVSKGKGAMPWLTDVLTHKQIAEVLTYVRTHFGNSYPEPVTEADVDKLAPPPPSGGH